MQLGENTLRGTIIQRTAHTLHQRPLHGTMSLIRRIHRSGKQRIEADLQLFRFVILKDLLFQKRKDYNRKHSKSSLKLKTVADAQLPHLAYPRDQLAKKRVKESAGEIDPDSQEKVGLLLHSGGRGELLGTRVIHWGIYWYFPP